ncbi:hypothetical protein MITS9504_03429 [Synechococcus sp. MIT S9504]|nr:hypothetical protein MITS9504_03429 [Synechococcus sp. MIT S9504]
MDVSEKDLFVLCLPHCAEQRGQPTSEVRFQDLSGRVAKRQIHRFFSSDSSTHHRGQHIDRLSVAVVTDACICAGQHECTTIVGVGQMKANSNRCQDLNKQLEMYRAFRDMDGVAAVTRELQMDACACPVKN